MKLNPTAASILGFLQDGPKTGYELLDTIECSVGYFWHTTKSQVYADLKRLEAASYIEMEETGTRNQRTCHLTDEGREAFETWIREPAPVERVRFPMALSVYFRDAVGDALLREAVTTHIAAHRARLDGYVELKPNLEERELRGPALTVSLGIRYEQAMLGWLEEVLETLEP